MREILFRGKIIESFEKGRWAYGFYTNDEYNEVYQKPCSEATDHYIENQDDCVRVDPETIGQFTGLTDKNGEKIFEGDVVDCSNAWWDAAGYAGHDSPIIEVSWDDEVCGFAPFAIYDCDCGVVIGPQEVEIIGNIHDNPELLKGNENV